MAKEEEKLEKARQEHQEEGEEFWKRNSEQRELNLGNTGRQIRQTSKRTPTLIGCLVVLLIAAVWIFLLVHGIIVW